MIGKIQENHGAFRINMFYYHRARDAMFEVVKQLVEKGYKDIYIPGYIGWSPREGSGIFDPLNQLAELKRHYYHLTNRLDIKVDELNDCLADHSIVLLVNYFGFRDKRIDSVINIAKEKECVVIEDNAHGFFTFFCNGPVGSDITFFSLHKMFPFNDGGGLLILNDGLNVLPNNCIPDHYDIDPFLYDINGIARRRKENYKSIMTMISGYSQYFEPIKTIEDIDNSVPQTFPIIIKCGNRDKIYELMNTNGFGVVSLYHTMIRELQNSEFSEACDLSAHIMNLPVHQDCDSDQYPQMLELLKECCLST